MCSTPETTRLLQAADSPDDTTTLEHGAALASLWFAPRRRLWPEVAGPRHAAPRGGRPAVSPRRGSNR